jgi:hypothetical protein
MDNIIFENRYEVTPELLKYWRSFSFKRSARHRMWVTLFFKIAFAYIALLCFFEAAWYSIFSFVVSGCIFAFLFFVETFLPGLRDRKHYKGALRANEREAQFSIYRFSDYIEFVYENITAKYQYEQICFIDEAEDYFVLWTTKGQLLNIYKNAFSVGNADLFGEFIRGKCAEAGSLWTKKQLSSFSLKRSVVRVIVIAFIVVYASYIIFGLFM